jgi:hypothetical protein
MATDVNGPPGPTLTSLVRGIVDDAQELFRQQFLMFRSEIREDLRRSRNAAILAAIGAAVAFIGAFLLLIMLPLLLNWLVPQIPLWACFGILGVILAAIGAGVIYAGVQKLKSVTPADQSVEALKENIRWTSHLM